MNKFHSEAKAAAQPRKHEPRTINVSLLGYSMCVCFNNSFKETLIDINTDKWRMKKRPTGKENITVYYTDRINLNVPSTHKPLVTCVKIP